jgi:hypothetical protein
MDRNGVTSELQSPRVLYSMYACGHLGLPGVVECSGRTFKMMTPVKHDFFAATGFYQETVSGEQAVLKVARHASFWGLPMAWVGRFINRREMHFYRRLQGNAHVPALIGAVGATGLLHEYAPGLPLSAESDIPDAFFDQMIELIQQLNSMGLAIVDTNKPENILLGDNGRPWIIDFQISYDRNRFLFGRWPAGIILNMFTRHDIYHVLKHKKRLRPDLLTKAERQIVEHQSWVIRLHRVLTKPYFTIRRRLFAYLRAKQRLMPEGSK